MKKGGLVWNLEHLLNEVKNGIAECKRIGKIPKTVAIDTWGVDYVLLDKDKKELKPFFCYRDGRTKEAVLRVEAIVPPEELYSHTGIQKQNFNTVYQLFDDKESGRLEKAEHFLMIPEYLSFKLTGKIKNEYINATTTGLVNAKTKAWDEEFIEKLGFSDKLFKKLNMPSSVIGGFSKEIQNEVGFNSVVLFAPSHDTASAVAACPIGENDLYISSGTWSLIGTEIKEPILTEKAREANFTNEGGIDFRFRFLKNYMGMWLFQNIRKNLDKAMTYDEMMKLAESAESFSYIDVNDDSFVAPENMIESVKTYLKTPKADLGYVLNSVYHSLAKSYKDAVDEIESITRKSFSAIHIVGGGCRDDYLNRLTSEYTGKKVTAGPMEATATGNIVSQIIYDKNITLEEARIIVKNSFGIKEI
ncbi:MAG: rhamnulokinase family protein [Clostridia bacterium]|nr:rhamnulokinase family protein [Clostridia bacterium]